MKHGDAQDRAFIRKFARILVYVWLDYREDSSFLINFFYRKDIAKIPNGKRIKVTIELEDYEEKGA